MANEFKIKNGLYVSGSVTITNNITVSGSLDIVGGITGSLSGSAISASHALDSDTLGGLPSSSFAPATTFNDVSSSYASASGSLSTRTTNLESTASVLTSASASFAAQSASLSTRVTNLEATGSKLTTASASFAVVSSSYASASGSLSTRTTNLESTASVLTSASASFAVVSSSYASASGSLSTRVTNLEATSSTVSSSFASTSGSIAGRVTTIESKYATTGSNTFTGAQRITDVSNAIGFASTASLYTDGGLRVTKDSFVSGTAYFNNVVVYGTSSIQYITSSQLNIGTNIINLNTDTPAVRFGGIAVADSGSNFGITGSLLWDSQNNRWIYSNPSGSTYDGGMLISGPRNTTGLGNEVGTTSCAVMIGQGSDHITSSGIFSYSNATCFYGTSLISGSGNACFSGQVCSATIVSAGSIQGTTLYGSTSICGGTVSGTTGAFSSTLYAADTITVCNSSAQLNLLSTNCVLSTINLGNVGTVNTSQISYDHGLNRLKVRSNAIDVLTFTNTGVSNFACRVCTPVITAGAGTSSQAIKITGDDNYIEFDNAGTYIKGGGNATFAAASTLFLSTSASTRLTIASTGAACFACELTAKSLGTNDLILNNLNYECANYVDGTRGSWLIQEGACDLFIINQVSGKKYKFNLIEIE